MRLLQIYVARFFIENVPTAGVVSLQFEATSWAEINKGKTKKNNGPQRLKINNVLEQRYIDREKSWLNARVLQEAADTSVPLLDRLRF
jgi:hypothetical protein